MSYAPLLAGLGHLSNVAYDADPAVATKYAGYAFAASWVAQFIGHGKVSQIPGLFRARTQLDQAFTHPPTCSLRISSSKAAPRRSLRHSFNRSSWPCVTRHSLPRHSASPHLQQSANPTLLPPAPGLLRLPRGALSHRLPPRPAQTPAKQDRRRRDRVPPGQARRQQGRLTGRRGADARGQAGEGGQSVDGVFKLDGWRTIVNRYLCVSVCLCHYDFGGVDETGSERNEGLERCSNPATESSSK